MEQAFQSTYCDGCPTKIVCHCLRVTEAEVIQMIGRHELRTVRDLSDHTGAGDGCTCCHAQLEDYLERFGCAAAVG